MTEFSMATAKLLSLQLLETTLKEMNSYHVSIIEPTTEFTTEIVL